MATSKKNNYITAELDWAEEQLKSWRQYIDDNPINSIKDRKDLKQTKAGGSYMDVVQTIEQQIKSVRDTMKEYLQLLDVVNRMREADDKKQEAARGGAEIPVRMRNRDGNKDE